MMSLERYEIKELIGKIESLYGINPAFPVTEKLLMAYTELAKLERSVGIHQVQADAE